MIQFILSSLAVASLLSPCAAQETAPRLPIRVQLQGAFISPLDGAKAVTQNNKGFTFGAALITVLPGTTIDARLGFSYQNFPGKAFGPAGEFNTGTAQKPNLVTVSQLKSAMHSYQLSGDILFDVGIPRTKVVLGGSLNRYMVRNQGGPLRQGVHYFDDPYYSGRNYFRVDYAWATQDYSGLKMGLRGGMETSLNRNLSLDLLFQLTELAGSKFDIKKKDFNRGPVNPSWIQLGARYTF